MSDSAIGEELMGLVDGLDHVQVDPGEDEVERLVVVHRDPTRLQVLVVRRRPG